LDELQTILTRFIKAQQLDVVNQTWLVALSGGVDSVVLSHLCSSLNIPFVAAHCNFNLRGDESIADKKFVTALAANAGWQLHTIDFDTTTYMAQHGLSVQVAARQLRYNWFKQLQQQHGYQYLATAHHATDNVETALMNLFRGTGIKGMRGILPNNANIIRPLLQANKEQIVQYATRHNLAWVTDSSNSSNKYTRNFIRNQVLPLMEQAIPRNEMGVEKTLQNLLETEWIYDEAIANYRKKLIEKNGADFQIPILKLLKIKAINTILYELITPFGFSALQVPDVLWLCQSNNGKYVQSATHRIIKNKNWLLIAPTKTEIATTILIEAGNTTIPFLLGTLHIKMLANTNATAVHAKNELEVMVDAAEIHFPLVLRPYKPGDYFYPLGMQKKKKLARFLIDKKLTTIQKEATWVLECNQKIIWVLGHRIDDRFKITSHTKAALALSLQPKN
jgi:tRNA(Ile)-lysidine synthase